MKASILSVGLALALVALSPLTELRLLAQPPGNRFAVRCLNKDSLVLPDKGGNFALKVELAVVLDREVRLKPGDFRLALLDAQLRQLDGVTIAIADDWKKKTFKKGENKDILTVTQPVPGPGEFDVGREYYLVVMVSDQLRFVKFTVGK